MKRITTATYRNHEIVDMTPDKGRIIFNGDIGPTMSRKEFHVTNLETGKCHDEFFWSIKDAKRHIDKMLDVVKELDGPPTQGTRK